MGPWSDQPSLVQYACFFAKVVTSIFTSHFVAPTNPYRPGVRSRTGKPCLGGRGSPFIAYTTSASRSSSSAPIGVLTENLSTDDDSTMSAPGWTPARASSSDVRTPSHCADPMRSWPTSFDTHSSVTGRSMASMASSSSQVIVYGWSTIPSIDSFQSLVSSDGGLSAVSMR